MGVIMALLLQKIGIIAYAWSGFFMSCRMDGFGLKKSVEI